MNIIIGQCKNCGLAVTGRGENYNDAQKNAIYLHDLHYGSPAYLGACPQERLVWTGHGWVKTDPNQ